VLRPDEQRLPAEDIGNRLRPGEEPIYKMPRTQVSEEFESDDENGGNR
jgi:hypothetical protein